MFSSDGCLHFSTLKEIGRSAAHYANAVKNGRPDSPSMLIGRAFHALALQGIEPLVFDGVRKGDKWKEFEETNKGADILNIKERDSVLRMRDSVFANPAALDVLGRCPMRETTIRWARHGYPCAGKVDAVGPSALAELKSTRDASRRKFLWDAHRMGYHGQLAWYDVGMGTAPMEYDTAWRDQFIIATENAAPFVTVVYQLDNLRIDQGNQLVEEWLTRFGACMESGEWLGYAQGVHIWDAAVEYQGDDEEDEE